MDHNYDFDAIVIGSGVTGGWAAKTLCERGLKTLMIDRGRMVEHGADYPTDGKGKFELPYRGEWPPGVRELYSRQPTARPDSHHFYSTDAARPYQFDQHKPFSWIRPDAFGGKSLLWGRHCYRWSDLDLEANKKDGHGVDWPVRYKDLAPWYSHVEKFVGISGEKLGLKHLPDGEFQPPMPFNIVEDDFRNVIAEKFEGRIAMMGRVANLTEDKFEQGRTKCQYRNQCHRGCMFGAYFSTQSTTLPAARATGNLTVKADCLAASLDYDATTQRVTGVRLIDTKTRATLICRSRIVFLCASCVPTNQILLHSKSEAMPNGLGNTHDLLGRFIMDHIHGVGVRATFRGLREEFIEYGRRPSSLIIPRFRNLDDSNEDAGFDRGYFYQWAARRLQPTQVGGFGATLKHNLRIPGPWQIYLNGFGEVLPYRDNRITLNDSAVDPFGLPQVKFDVTWRSNEAKMAADIVDQARQMADALEPTDIQISSNPSPPGRAIHEMGGAPMGADPAQSIVNKWNQMHVASNVFITDGAAMSSGSCVNPSLTFMAFTARAADHAAALVKQGSL